MSLLKKKLDINIDGEEYVMMFDMKSIAIYKELTKENFAEGFLKLQLFDDNAAINFLACTLRKKENPNEPLGKEYIENGNLLLGLAVLRLDAIEYVNMSLPEVKKGKK
ncbi:hypothetical protein LI064_03010 [Clostridium perfringens]|uniref:hypothetical protein n=1 Tax=Clostridium perfringens TaxID=1502 RepID=UPI002247E8DE|nr:hypothetical protein [Clostridium perfringens]MCX0353493.1 hypothetical protein [Clostridium perfringens]